MKKLIAITALSLSIVTTAVYATMPSEPVVDKPQAQQKEVQSVSEPAQPVEEVATPVEPTPTQEQAPSPVAEEQAPSFKWAAEMQAAGIAESDYAIVEEMMFVEDGFHWNKRSENDKPLWSLAFECRSTYGQSIPDCLSYANKYIASRYGSWSVAYQHFLVNPTF